MVGRRATIRGRVVDSYFASSSSGQPTFLNMGHAYPNPSRFTIVIWRENRGTFGGSPENRFLGHVLCVTGLVQTYGGVPEIIARSAAQIRVVG
jgi:DNA/RNA endonuclease YhcR with UshA esterase domain